MALAKGAWSRYNALQMPKIHAKLFSIVAGCVTITIIEVIYPVAGLLTHDENMLGRQVS
jgi:hypothetical protein